MRSAGIFEDELEKQNEWSLIYFSVAQIPVLHIMSGILSECNRKAFGKKGTNFGQNPVIERIVVHAPGSASAAFFKGLRSINTPRSGGVCLMPRGFNGSIDPMDAP